MHPTSAFQFPERLLIQTTGRRMRGAQLVETFTAALRCRCRERLEQGCHKGPGLRFRYAFAAEPRRNLIQQAEVGGHETGHGPQSVQLRLGLELDQLPETR